MVMKRFFFFFLSFFFFLPVISFVCKGCVRDRPQAADSFLERKLMGGVVRKIKSEEKTVGLSLIKHYFYHY